MIYYDCSNKQHTKGSDKVSPLKKGAKLTDNPKDFMLRTRLDNETLEKLDYSAEKFGISRSEVVRNGIEDEYQKAKKK